MATTNGKTQLNDGVAVTPAALAGEVINQKYMWTVLACGTFALMFDGVDQMIYSMIAPWIMHDWKLTTVQVGLIGSMFLVGHGAGPFLSSTAADRVGRKPLLVITPLFYSVFTSLAGFMQGIYSMGLLRALTGLGTGGVHPVVISMVGENVPSKSRARYMALMNSGYPIGFLLSIVLTGTVGVMLRAKGYTDWSWKWCYILAGIPGIITAVCVWKFLKESAMFLKTRAERKAQGIKSFSVFDLFRPGQIRNSITCIVMYVGVLMSYWGIGTWAPTYLATQRHIAVAKMAGYMVFWTLGAWVGQLVGGTVMDKFGRKPALTIYFLGIGASSLLYGWVTSPSILFWLSPVSGFFTLGVVGPIAIYATELFPTSMRATGIGFSGGLARVFSIATPTIIGFIALKFGIGAGFYMFALIMVVTTIVFWILGPETKAARLD